MRIWLLPLTSSLEATATYSPLGWRCAALAKKAAHRQRRTRVETRERIAIQLGAEFRLGAAGVPGSSEGRAAGAACLAAARLALGDAFGAELG